MRTMSYVAPDVHMRTISDCVKDASGGVYGRRFSSSHKLRSGSMDEILPQLWTAAMEATVFTGWTYDHL